MLGGDMILIYSKGNLNCAWEYSLCETKSWITEQMLENLEEDACTMIDIYTVAITEAHPILKHISRGQLNYWKIMNWESSGGMNNSFVNLTFLPKGE